MVIEEVCQGPMGQGGLHFRLAEIQGLPLCAFPIFTLLYFHLNHNLYDYFADSIFWYLSFYPLIIFSRGCINFPLTGNFGFLHIRLILLVHNHMRKLGFELVN